MIGKVSADAQRPERDEDELVVLVIDRCQLHPALQERAGGVEGQGLVVEVTCRVVPTLEVVERLEVTIGVRAEQQPFGLDRIGRSQHRPAIVTVRRRRQHRPRRSP
jgi:hypothetical protein